MLGVGAFALVFGMVGAWLIGRRITDPLQRLAEAASGVDRHLAENPHYRYARELGQLGPVRPVRVRDGARLYEARLAAGAQRAGVIKPAELHTRPGWLSHFSEVAS